MLKNVAVALLTKALLDSDARQAVKYVSEKEVIRATRRAYKGRRQRYREEVLISVCKPNYRERDFIWKCKDAKEPFPIKKIQYKFFKK